MPRLLLAGLIAISTGLAAAAVPVRMSGGTAVEHPGLTSLPVTTRNTRIGIIHDLGGLHIIHGVAISWLPAGTPVTFSIQVSHDRRIWRELISGHVSTGAGIPEPYVFPYPESVRYLRILPHESTHASVGNIQALAKPCDGPGYNDPISPPGEGPSLPHPPEGGEGNVGGGRGIPVIDSDPAHPADPPVFPDLRLPDTWPDFSNGTLVPLPPGDGTRLPPPSYNPPPSYTPPPYNGGNGSGGGGDIGIPPVGDVGSGGGGDIGIPPVGDVGNGGGGNGGIPPIGDSGP